MPGFSVAHGHMRPRILYKYPGSMRYHVPMYVRNCFNTNFNNGLIVVSRFATPNSDSINNGTPLVIGGLSLLSSIQAYGVYAKQSRDECPETKQPASNNHVRSMR